MPLESERIVVEDPAPLDIPGTGVVAHWYRPQRVHARNAVGIVVLPIQGGDYEVSTLFAEAFAKRGFHTLRFERRYEWLDPSVPLDVLARLVPQYVADIRRGIDLWLERADAPQRLGLFGVSMGAITGTLLAAADPRLRATVLCIGGGGLGDILVHGRDEELDAWRLAVAEELGGPEAFVDAARGLAEHVDVLGQAPRVPTDSTFFIAARFDRVVPWFASRQLWQALGRPRRTILPTGHYSAVVAVPWIKHAAARWFDRKVLVAG